MSVPGLEGLLELLLPPQATKAAASKARTSKPKASLARRFFPSISSRRAQANIAPVPGINQRGRLNKRNATEGAVVLTVSVVEPPGTEKEVGTREQLL